MSITDVPADACTQDLTVAVIGKGKLVLGQKTKLTLLWLANQYCRVSLQEIRALNPHLDTVPADTPLPLWTQVRLPSLLTEQFRIETMTGERFVLGEAEERLRACNDRLDRCLQSFLAERGSDLPSLPRRRVRPPLEQLREVMDAAVEEQLPGVEAQYRELGNRDSQIPRLVKVGPVHEQLLAIQHDFVEEAQSLTSFQPANVTALNALIGGGLSRGRLDSKLTAAAARAVSDLTTDTCGVHTHRWEFAVWRPESARVWAELAFLSCQPLTSMVDAMQNMCLSHNSNGYPFSLSKDSFLYIAGTFYVDDRHDGFVDLTESIRSFQLPTVEGGVTDEAGRGGNMFQRCPVASASATHWKDVVVREGELCAVRHLGGCTHFFYLNSVTRLKGASARHPRTDYPLCIAKAEDEALPCQLCRTYPSTVALYNDALSPTVPAVYCPICFAILHDNDSASKANSYVTIVPRNPGDYFMTT